MVLTAAVFQRVIEIITRTSFFYRVDNADHGKSKGQTSNIGHDKHLYFLKIRERYSSYQKRNKHYLQVIFWYFTTHKGQAYVYHFLQKKCRMKKLWVNY